MRRILFAQLFTDHTVSSFLRDSSRPGDHLQNFVMGIDLAYAQLDDEEHVTVRPCNIKVNVGNDTFDGKFFCMQYVYQEVENGNWHYYNDDSISFFDNAGGLQDVTMVKTKGNFKVSRSAVKRNGKAHLTGEDKPLRGKVYVPREGKSAVKAVKF